MIVIKMFAHSIKLTRSGENSVSFVGCCSFISWKAIWQKVQRVLLPLIFFLFLKFFFIDLGRSLCYAFAHIFFSIAPGFVANITVKNMLINRETELKTYFRLLQCRSDKFHAVIRFRDFFCFLVFRNWYQHLN